MSNKDDWELAEQFAVDHMRHLGFRDAELTRSGADGGLDAESTAAVAQVKHWKTSISRPDVQRLNGAAPANKARLFYSASGFTRDARRFADDNNIALFEYDLDTGEAKPISITAIRLDNAISTAQSAPRSPRIAPDVSPRPQTHHQPAVQTATQPRPLRWYFILTVLTGSGFAWAAFLHAYLQTSNPRWRRLAISFGVWCPILYVIAPLSSPSSDGSVDSEPGATVLRSIVAVITLTAIIVACLALVTARNEVLDPGSVRSTRSQSSSSPIPKQPTTATESAPSHDDQKNDYRGSSAQPAPSAWQEPSRGRLIGSIAWALSPLLTLGFGTPITFAIAAFRRKTFEMIAYAAVYLGLWIWMLVLDSDTRGGVPITIWIVLSWLLANAHTFVIRRRVWYKQAPQGDDTSTSSASTDDASIEPEPAS
jgi:hypothetical protein